MGKSEQSRSYLAEDFIEGLLEKKGAKVTRLFIANNGPELNEKILNLFLRIYSKNENLFQLLKELNSQGFQLPDFLCLKPKTNTPAFYEVKSENRKLKLSYLKKEQKEAIKKIANEGYDVYITNVHFKFEEAKFDEKKYLRELLQNFVSSGKKEEKFGEYFNRLGEQLSGDLNKEQGRVMKGEFLERKSSISFREKISQKSTNNPHIFMQEAIISFVQI